MIKRIIEGVAYNTETSTKVARSEYDQTSEGGPRGYQTLYQTRGGAFFLHSFEVSDYKDRHGEWQERESNHFEPMSRDVAQGWVLNAGQVELLSDAFGEPPEAAAGDTGAWHATIYARVPVMLKDRVEASAKAAGLSVNSVVIRCLERYVLESSAPPAPQVNSLLASATSGGILEVPPNRLMGLVSPGTPLATPRNALLPD
jgi:hypothetical protein